MPGCRARRGQLLLAATMVATVFTAVACSGSSGKSNGSPSTSAGATTSSPTQAVTDSHPYTLGVLTDLTGPASGTEKQVVLGVKAGVGLANSEGYKFKYVVADAQTSPTGVTAAAHQLVEQDHVDAVIAESALTFAAAPYLAAQGIPVIGAATDGTEWITMKNMFSVFGTPDYHKVNSGLGDFLKLVSAKNLAAMGYSIPPSANLSAKASAESARNAGLQVGYENSEFPLGSTNVGPAAIAIKNAGSDALSASLLENTVFALITTLHQNGVKLTAPVLATGYGGELLTAGSGEKTAAQGAYFTMSYEPVEMQTAATKKFASAMNTYAGVNNDPQLNEYIGYASVDLFKTALQKTGPAPSHEQLINTILGIRSYNAAGLFGSHSIGFALDQRGIYQGADNCIWYVQFSGNSFHLVNGATPLCGKNLPQTVK
jgi:branched-chain amino acid transport system substrate-binding protein